MPLQLQMLPSEMLPLTRNEPLPGGNVIRQGIEFDRIGRRAAYHFLRRHPGDMTDPGLSGETVRVPAAEVIHVVDPVDAGQLRGVSRFAPGIVKLFLLDQYDDAELDRKKVAAMHALFITTPAPAEPFDAAESDEAGERTMDLQPGQVVMLEPGEEVQTSAPADVGQTYEPFQYRTLLQVSAALGIPYANNLDRIETIRADGRIDGADPSVAALTGRIEVRFAEQALLTQATDGTPAELSFAYSLASGESFTLVAHAVYLPKPRLPIQGPQGVQASFDWQAARDPVTGRMATATLVNAIAGY